MDLRAIGAVDDFRLDHRQYPRRAGRLFRDSRLLKAIGIAVMALQPLPTYIVGLALVIFLGYLWPIFPISGGAQ